MVATKIIISSKIGNPKIKDPAVRMSVNNKSGIKDFAL